MFFRSIFLVALLAGSASISSAQQPRNVNNPSITQKPVYDPQGVRNPEYPIEALRKGLGGNTVLTLCVDAGGAVASAEVSKSSGHQILDDAALKWMKTNARFRPAQASGQPVPVCNYTFTYVWEAPEATYTRPDERFEEIADYEKFQELAPESRPFIRSQPPAPNYPSKALAQKVEGVVKLDLCVSAEGKIASANVYDINTNFDLLSATMHWFGASVYEPGKKDGRPVGVCGLEVEREWKLPR